MKTKLTILKPLIVLCSTVATTTIFGQVITWIGPDAALPGGADFGRSTNWSGQDGFGGSSPRGGTVCTFSGVVPGNLVVYAKNGIDDTGRPIGTPDFSIYGVSIDLTPAQLGRMNLICATNASQSVMVLSDFRIQSGAGQFIFGNNTTNQLIASLRPPGGTHSWINLSANPVVINPNFQIQNGGGAPGHVIRLKGSGDFNITNNLRFNNNAPGQTLQWQTSGTTIWHRGGDGTGTDAYNKWNSPLGNVVIDAGARDDMDNLTGNPVGTVIIKSAGLLPAGGTVQHDGTLLKFDAAAQVDTMPRAISGSGPIQISDGHWTFSSGASTFTNSINLTGGTLFAGGMENPGTSGPLGVGGTITFNSGTLGFSANNTFDYSPRFNTAAGQQYRFDTAGQDVTFTNNLASSGATLTKLGEGTLRLKGTTSYPGGPFTGLTTVSAGRLIFQGPKTGNGYITVADGATLGVYKNGTQFEVGTQVTPGVLALGSGSGCTLEFNNVSYPSTALLAAGAITSSGTVTININSGTFTTIGQSFSLITWTSGFPPAVSLGTVNGAGGFLSTNGQAIQFNVTSLPLIWLGTNGGNWTAPGNWTMNSNAATFAPFTHVVFNDTATGTTAVTVDALVQPTSVSVSNNTKTYTITSSAGNNIAVTTGITKGGTNTLTLVGGANSYAGVTTINGGTVSVGVLANGGVVSDIGSTDSGSANLVLDGGTLRYTGSAVSSDRLFTLGLAGGAIDASGSGSFVFSNPGSLGYIGNGPRSFTLTGDAQDNTLAGVLADHGGATTLTKDGAGKWILAGNNTYSGGTTIAGGVLQIGNDGASGAVGSGNIVNNGHLIFNRTGTATVSGAVSGTGSVTNNGTGTVILANDNTYSGGTINNSGTLQVGNGGTTGKLNANGAITNNGTLIFNSAGAFTLNSGISGTGQLLKQGSGVLKLLGNNTYAGNTTIGSRATLQVCEGTQGALTSPVITITDIDSHLLFVRQDFGVFVYGGNIGGNGSVRKDGAGDVTLTGTNTYTGGTFIHGGSIILGDGVTPGAGSIVGGSFGVSFGGSAGTYRSLVFNRPDDFICDVRIQGSSFTNSGAVVHAGTGTVTLTGNNTYRVGTVINAGALQMGDGGTSGSIGSGPVTDNSVFILNRSDNVTLSNSVSGTGSLVKQGSGTLTLTGTNTYIGATAVNVGKLVFQGAKTGSGSITVANGAALGVFASGTQVTPNALILAAGSTLEFNNVNSITTAPLAASALSSAGTVTININSGTFPTFGQSFPLLTWTSGSPPPVSLGAVNGTLGNLSTNGNTIQFNVIPVVLTWSGANNGNWDTTTTNNWTFGGNPTKFTNAAPVLFDDTASGTTTVTVNGVLQPALFVVNNNNKTYNITSSAGNNIAGGTGLSKSGDGTLTLSGGDNSYTGATTISGGTLSVAMLTNGGSVSDIGASSNNPANLVLNGGALQYTGGGASLGRLFTLGPNGGAIDASGSGVLNLTNLGSVALDDVGARMLTLTGTNAGSNTLAAALGDNSISGATSLTKSGPGKWILTGNNTYSGGTTIAGGVLQIGDGISTGSGAAGTGDVTNNGALVLNRPFNGGVTLGSVRGVGSIMVIGHANLPGDNTYTGGTTINPNATLTIQRLVANASIINNGGLYFNSVSNFTFDGVISGTGSLIKTGSGTLTLTASNTYGGTVINSGTLLFNGNKSGGESTVFAGGTLGGTGTLSGPVTLYVGSSLAPGASVGSIGTLTINSNLTLGGNLAIEVSKSLAQSNDLVVVSGTLTNNGTGTITVSNLGPTLSVGDRFTLFSQPLMNGAAMIVTGAGANWANDLATDGSISVLSFVPAPTLNWTNTGSGVQFSWSGSFKLQSQTNNLNVGISTNWSDYPGGGTSPITVPIDATEATIFFRLVSTP